MTEKILNVNYQEMRFLILKTKNKFNILNYIISLINRLVDRMIEFLI